MEFKYYVTYATMVHSDELEKRFEKLAKVLKKHKMELVFWGHPWGTTENLMLVMKGDVKDYEKLMNQSEVSEATSFYTDNRTHLVIAP
jgi:hypothetical protein